ncbi:MAG: DEAD/DEAH box helicase [Gammaproteobacteria bacterium]|nr:DEAD/DEAH box helicase [Gammaproteobacteria bacterium]
MIGKNVNFVIRDFHPAVTSWFTQSFLRPTQTQLSAWQDISAGGHTLVSAPTGSGKTLAAFLVAIDGLVRQAEQGILKPKTSVIYVSPLKSLSNDIQRNLQVPLYGIEEILNDLNKHENIVFPSINAAVRTGDTTSTERAKMVKCPPHILVTTPESLYILLTSKSGRQMLSSAKTLIIDEIHTMVGTKRGAHLSISIERLEYLCDRQLLRIGLTATQRPIELAAKFLVSNRENSSCQIIDSGHQRDRDIRICVFGGPLSAVMSNTDWEEVYSMLEELIYQHNTTLIFVNTRRLAERMSKALGERIGDDAVTSHHGSLAKEHRLMAEQRLKAGTLKAIVATASLELGIDIGDVDLVCQIGSPRAVSILLQRIGRSGHNLGHTPKGRLFPTSRDDLLECIGLIDCVNRDELDHVSMYPKPLDVLAQQIVAEVSTGQRNLEDLFLLMKRAAPFEALEYEEFSEVIRMLSEGFSGQRGRHSAYLHLDAVNDQVRPRKSASLTAMTNGGTIPDLFDYDVVLHPENLIIGSLNEDFSFESMAGDIFQLGNTSYRIERVELGKVHVRDAKGQPPTIPFWFGEAPGRTDVVSRSVSRVKASIRDFLAKGLTEAKQFVEQEYGLEDCVSSQLIHYLATAKAALGALPDNNTIIIERFFDEAGDQHLVIHSSFGIRINRAWGLALRKRFCRKFNFELQAAALEDAIILSLGPTHSFPIDEPIRYLSSENVTEVLSQAILDTPFFATHWRWNASIALAVKRFSGGSKTPPQFQRSNAEDLASLVFPDHLACAENISGKREIPDHPLIRQTMYDCLHNLMDLNGLKRVLERLETGTLNLICKDLAAPSPLTEEILAARNYAFLDDAPAEERRTRLVRSQIVNTPQDAESLGVLDAGVICEIKEEIWPHVDNADECHDALLVLGGLVPGEAESLYWTGFLNNLAKAGRACQITFKKIQMWVAAERLAYWEAVHPELEKLPSIEAAGQIQEIDRDQAIFELLKLRLQCIGPTTEQELASFFGVTTTNVNHSLTHLEQIGFVMRGIFDQSGQYHQDLEQWCERRLLWRMRQRSIQSRRKRASTVSINTFMKFLFEWHGLTEAARSLRSEQEGLMEVLAQLEGIELPAAVWEEAIFPDRLDNYSSQKLDMLCSSGRFIWTRLNGPDHSRLRGSNRQSPVAFVPRNALIHWFTHSRKISFDVNTLSWPARRLMETLRDGGAQFFEDLVNQGGWVATEVRNGLSELVGLGLAVNDNFEGMRSLYGKSPSKKRKRGRWSVNPRDDGAGRWSLLNRPSQQFKLPEYNSSESEIRWESVEYIAKCLLRRYGVVFRRLLDQESSCPPWRDLLYVFRRMEARGEIQGGRFVDGFAGEQFALGEAAGLLKQCNSKQVERVHSINTCDPLNLTGTVIPSERVPMNRKVRLIFLDGKPVAKQVNGSVEWLVVLDTESKTEIANKTFLNVRMTRGKSNSLHPM